MKFSYLELNYFLSIDSVIVSLLLQTPTESKLFFPFSIILFYLGYKA